MNQLENIPVIVVNLNENPLLGGREFIDIVAQQDYSMFGGTDMTARMFGDHTFRGTVLLGGKKKRLSGKWGYMPDGQLLIFTSKRANILMAFTLLDIYNNQIFAMRQSGGMYTIIVQDA